MNVLDLNDNNPQLDHSTFNSEYIISEDIKRNTTIATINATDVDLNTVNNFRILDDPSIRAAYTYIYMHICTCIPSVQTIHVCALFPLTETLFKIDHQTGVLQTEGGPNDFDRESFANYTITFEVHAVRSSTCLCQIHCFHYIDSCPPISIGLQR